MTIFKIVDKSAVESSDCSGRRVCEFGEGKFGGMREIRKCFVLGNLMVSPVICGGEYEVNLKFEFAIGV